MNNREEEDKLERKPYFISEQTGKLLEKLILLTNSKSILEIGAGDGYSTLFLAKAAKKNNGSVITIEPEQESSARASNNMKKARLSKIVEIKTGDSLNILNKLNKKFDFVFIDGKKRDYLKYLKAIINKLNRDCMVVAHNVISHKEKVQDYLDFVKKKYSSYTLDFDKGIEISILK